MILLMASRELEPNEITNEEKCVFSLGKSELRFWTDLEPIFLLFSFFFSSSSFALFLRLHLAICLTWICKGLALLADDKLVIYSNVMYAVHGLVIFVLFVMNQQMFHLIHQRYVTKKPVFFLFSFINSSILKTFSDGNRFVSTNQPKPISIKRIRFQMNRMFDEQNQFDIYIINSKCHTAQTNHSHFH